MPVILLNIFLNNVCMDVVFQVSIEIRYEENNCIGWK